MARTSEPEPLRRGHVLLHAEGDGPVDLGDEVLPRVGPEAKRKITPGPDGIRLPASGGTPGQAHEAPGSAEPGAPDPLA